MKSIKPFILQISTALLLVTLSGCQSIQSDNEISESSKEDGWLEASPAEQGFDPEFISNLSQNIINNQPGYQRINSLAVARNGYLIVDLWKKQQRDSQDISYGNPHIFAHSLQGASKGFLGVLVGIAIDEGYIRSLDQSIYDFVPKSEVALHDITIRQVLNMSMGKAWDEWSFSYASIENPLRRFNLEDKSTYLERVLDLRQIKTPGEEFNYFTPSTNLLAYIIQRAVGQPVANYFYEKMIKPMQAGDIHVITINQRPDFGTGLFMSTRDLAKLGQLILDGGQWQGQQMVSHQYINRMLTPIFPVNAFDENYRTYYGLHWWIIERKLGLERIAIFGVIGDGGQYVVAVPQYDLVIATNGNAYGEMPPDGLNLIWEIIVHLQEQKNKAVEVSPVLDEASDQELEIILVPDEQPAEAEQIIDANIQEIEDDSGEEIILDFTED